MGCDYTIGQDFTLATFIEDGLGSPFVDPSFEIGDVQILNTSNVYQNTTNLPVVTPAGTNRIELTITASEAAQSQLSIRFLDQTGDWSQLIVELKGESEPNTTPTSPAPPGTSTAPITSTSTEQLPGQYADVLASDRFVIEYREGTKMGRMMDPKQMREFMEIARENDALKKRRSNGMTRQIVD